MLHAFTFNFYDLFVPDLLHEFELGVWKATFIHLLRVLIAAGGDRIQMLNERYSIDSMLWYCSCTYLFSSLASFRRVPTFGRDTVRRFTNNTSAMKKLGARDWEDILQCSLPVFEGLLDEPYNTIVLDLLWALATWHALAKLRMHTSLTVTYLDDATTVLGQNLRHFKNNLCDHFATKELPREEAARGRRTAAVIGKGRGRGIRGQGRGRGSRGAGRGRVGVRGSVRGRGGDASGDDEETPANAQAGGPRIKMFNLSTYKLHALGDYVKMIRLFGSSDNVSTQTVRVIIIALHIY